jgi:hypothetical protein
LFSNATSRSASGDQATRRSWRSSSRRPDRVLRGLAIFGIPLWWICHRLGWRSARTALALGFLATFSVSLILNGPQLIFGRSDGAYGDGGMSITEGTPHGLYRSLWESFEFALLGAAVGGLVWRLAYRGPNVRWDIIPGRE